jgi:glycosyltransferase involved in cell wall biosynthesis
VHLVDEAARQLGVDLVCTGYLENSTAQAIVGRAVALVHLSVSEGFGLAVAEAQAQGVVAVVGAVGGLVDIVADGETGYLVPADFPNFARKRLQAIIDDSSLRERLAADARTRMKREFSKEVSDGLMLRAFEDAEAPRR